MGFDSGGRFTSISRNERIEYAPYDGRKVSIFWINLPVKDLVRSMALCREIVFARHPCPGNTDQSASVAMGEKHRLCKGVPIQYGLARRCSGVPSRCAPQCQLSLLTGRPG